MFNSCNVFSTNKILIQFEKKILHNNQIVIIAQLESNIYSFRFDYEILSYIFNRINFAEKKENRI